ncbi:hypothetical protein E2C01_045431 [Portunus trituberculatus]|uniref:Uncharacterized protein n=1 Tax=Portunus trituberculatus TaxID=210409 RepID=A0A5B7FYC1_PORTR|nr:hypothetical protein [Portunus trituberculatus]
MRNEGGIAAAAKTDLQTTPARKSNDLCASDRQFSYCDVNGIPKQRMCDCFSDCSNGEDQFVQVCGECRDQNVGCERLCMNIRVILPPVSARIQTHQEVQL